VVSDASRSYLSPTECAEPVSLLLPPALHHRPDLFESLQDTMMKAVSTLEAQPNHAEAQLVLHRCLLYYQQAVKKLSENRMLRGKEIIGRVSTLIRRDG
jgi:hypothetical protein